MSWHVVNKPGCTQPAGGSRDSPSDPLDTTGTTAAPAPIMQSGGSARGYSPSIAVPHHRGCSGPAVEKCCLRPEEPGGAAADRAGPRGQLERGEAERFGVGPPVVLGQHLADGAWPAGDGAVADLAAGNRQVGDGHRKAAGTWLAHHFYDARSVRMSLPYAMCTLRGRSGCFPVTPVVHKYPDSPDRADRGNLDHRRRDEPKDARAVPPARTSARCWIKPRVLRAQVVADFRARLIGRWPI